MRKPLIAGNWKMHMTCAQARALVDDLKERLRGEPLKTRVVLAPPFTSLHVVSDALANTGWDLAAQNAFWEDQGAYTGEISPAMLVDSGCRFVIVGHSERRQILNETDEVVGKKMRAVMRHGITPILCVGESLREREEGRTLAVVQRQLEGALGDLDDDETPDWVVAYEPIWAIGTGRTATSQQAQEVHFEIRRWMKEQFSSQRAERTAILYGGSVKPTNIDDLMSQEDIDGALVGGASLEAESFARIITFRTP